MAGDKISKSVLAFRAGHKYRLFTSVILHPPKTFLVELWKIETLNRLNAMTLDPIFIHSMWRTSSTYVWHCFRRLDPVKGYYEPYHSCLRSMSPENAESRGDVDLGHSLGTPYWTEYGSVAPKEGGMPFFQKRFAVRNYVPPTGGLKEGEQKYLNYLIEGGANEGLKPCLGFVRSSMRAGAIRSVFGGTHIALIRNPFSQFTSCYRRSGFLESINNVVAVIQSRFSRVGSWLERKTKKHELEYHDAIRFSVYYLFSNISAVTHSDIIIDTDLLGSDPKARQAANRSILEFTDLQPDFSDCRTAGSTEDELRQHYEIVNRSLTELSKLLKDGAFSGLNFLLTAYPQVRPTSEAIALIDSKRISSFQDLTTASKS